MLSAVIDTWGLQIPDSCGPRCGLDNAPIMHMFWECVELGGFWRDVLNVICSVHHIRLSADPRICILGILDDLESDSPVSLGISRMLFQETGSPPLAPDLSSDYRGI